MTIAVFYYALGIFSFIAIMLSHIWGWYKRYDDANRFIRDIALIHLPYITRSLVLLGTKLNVPVETPPPIQFVPRP